jgi:hypothetical protein
MLHYYDHSLTSLKRKLFKHALFFKHVTYKTLALLTLLLYVPPLASNISFVDAFQYIDVESVSVYQEYFLAMLYIYV